MSAARPALGITACAAAVAAYAHPALGELLVYDRALVLRGELWRLATAPLVHFSTPHLVWDALVLGAASWVLEREWARARLALLFFLAALSAGAFLLLFAPEVVRYGGLSGLAAAAVAGVCLDRLVREAGARRVIWLALLGLLAAKICWERAHGVPLFAGGGDAPFRVLPQVHAAGAVSAAVVLAPSLFRRRSPDAWTFRPEPNALD